MDFFRAKTALNVASGLKKGACRCINQEKKYKNII